MFPAGHYAASSPSAHCQDPPPSVMVTHVLNMLLGWNQGPVLGPGHPLSPCCGPCLAQGTHTVGCAVLMGCPLANGISCLLCTRDNLGKPTGPQPEGWDMLWAVCEAAWHSHSVPCTLVCSWRLHTCPHSSIPRSVLRGHAANCKGSLSLLQCCACIPRLPLCRGLTTLASGSPQGLRVAG